MIEPYATVCSSPATHVPICHAPGEISCPSLSTGAPPRAPLALALLVGPPQIVQPEVARTAATNDAKTNVLRIEPSLCVPNAATKLQGREGPPHGFFR